MADAKQAPAQPEMIYPAKPSFSKAVLEAAAKWTEKEKTPLFVMTCYRDPQMVAFSRNFVDEVYKHRKMFQGVETLDILLDHFGGDIDASYQLVNFFRRHCTKLRIFIPDYAKSAATLLALGADELWMSEIAEMGPLDAQIPDPRDPDKYISALDEFRAVDYLRTHSFEILNEFVRMLGRTTSLSTKDKLHIASEHTTKLMQQLYSNVDPLHFGGSHRSVELGTEYGQRVMSRWAYRDWTARRIETTVKKLTWDYPSHSFSIDFKEAESIGLKAKLLDGELDDLAHTIVAGLPECAGFLSKPQPPALSVVEGGKE